MKSSLIIPVLAWFLIIGSCVALIIGLGMDTITSLSLVIFVITLLFAALVYFVGKHLEQMRIRSPHRYETLSEIVGILLLLGGFVWAAIDEIRNLEIKSSKSGYELWWRIAVAAAIIFTMLEVIYSIVKARKEGYQPQTKPEKRSDAWNLYYGSAVLAGITLYAIWPSLPQAAHINWSTTKALISVATAYIPIWLFFMLAIITLTFLGSGVRAAISCLPAVWPRIDGHNDGRFTAKGKWLGTWLTTERVYLMPVPILGRGYWWRCSGEAWLENEALVFRSANGAVTLVIPYGLIHEANAVIAHSAFKGPQLVLRIIWGRPELAMLSQMRLQLSHDVQNRWVQEIMRRAGVWKDKMAAIQAEQAQ
jgi:hypothetical protein